MLRFSLANGTTTVPGKFSERRQVFVSSWTDVGTISKFQKIQVLQSTDSRQVLVAQTFHVQKGLKEREERQLFYILNCLIEFRNLNETEKIKDK